MFNIGHNGWLVSNLTIGKKDPFSVSFNITQPVAKMSFNDAADYTANIISQKYSNLHLCLSGGLDSEYVAKVLLRNNISFIPVILATRNAESEYWYAFKFCEENNITPIVFDYSDYRSHQTLLKMILDTAVKYRLLPNIALAPQIIQSLIPDAELLTGYGDPLNISKNYNDRISSMLEITYHDYLIELTHSNNPGAFFSYTPEIFRALINEIDYTKTSQLAKSELYNLLVRSKSKNTLSKIDIESLEIRNLIEVQRTKFARDAEVYFINKDKMLSILS